MVVENKMSTAGEYRKRWKAGILYHDIVPFVEDVLTDFTDTTEIADRLEKALVEIASLKKHGDKRLETLTAEVKKLNRALATMSNNNKELRDRLDPFQKEQ